MIFAPQSYIALNTRGATLKWAPGVEPDLLGYEVWISNRQGGPYSKLHDGVLKDIFFRSEALRYGTFFLVVTAIDNNENRSLRSNEVEVTIW